jgi:HlyD family secretion protein
MKLLRQVWGLLSRTQRRRVLAAQALSLVMGFTTLVGIAAIVPFFAVLASPELIERKPALHWLYHHLGFADPHAFAAALGILFVGAFLGGNAVNLWGFVTLNRLALGVGEELQSALFAEYLGRPYLFHTRTHSAALSNHVLYTTACVTNGILQNGFTLITYAVTAAFIIVPIVVLEPLLAAAVIGVLAGGYALAYIIVRNRLLRAGQLQSAWAAEQARIARESFGAIKEILVHGSQPFFRSGFEHSTRAISRATAHILAVSQAPRHIMECAAVATLVALALGTDGRSGGAGPWLSRLTFLGFAAYRLLPTLQQAFAAAARVRANRAALDAIAPDLQLAHNPRATAPALDARWLERPRTDIELREVSFGYGPERPLALERVRLRIPARSALGLIGPNGAGKTTLVDLIAGLLTPTAGHIEIDGIVLDADNRAAWQARIGYVPQNACLLDASIAQNIAFGVAPEAIDQARLLKAAQLAQLDTFVRTLPEGYAHRIGERGRRLSGGQRQRVAIARALYTAGSVLILDEAMNALDGLTERELTQTLQGLRGEYTLILIAHRRSTLRCCDLLVELDGGRIIRSGSYEELLEHSATARRIAGVR